ncbi:hypothetical protein FHU37_001669 [Allostreptomyces psammosilenae]|uniref:Uncharacterized protein n=1 Tax=Allostreptomyces psammosilenae TaxID=1892865 RepID=A0A852ZQK4_9ACTN|nr:hypothetical protein [Allostreptomyces psammosilenae]
MPPAAATRVKTDGHSRVNPLVALVPRAKAISKTMAIAR